MKMVAISQELSSTSYPGRGIIIGRSADGSKAVTAYFIMGRSVNSRMHRTTHLVFLVSCMWRMQNSTMPCLF